MPKATPSASNDDTVADAEADVEVFKNGVKQDGEKLIREVFPRKVLFLQNLLKSDAYSLSRIKAVREEAKVKIPIPDAAPRVGGDDEPADKKQKLNGDGDSSGSPVYRIPGGAIVCNTVLESLIEDAKPIVRDLIEHTNILKMWITFLIPKIEDGNNFGVGIQEDTLGQVSVAEQDSASYFDTFSKYYQSRGMLITKAAKYPHVIDYRKAVQELDEKQFINMRIMLCELRNTYCSLHDIILKNIQKLKNPRNNNAVSMY